MPQAPKQYVTRYKLFLLLVSALSAFQVHSQEPENIRLFVYNDSIGVVKFEVANINTETEGTYENDEIFIKAKAGDRLLIASNQFRNHIISVTEKDVAEKKKELYFTTDLIELEAVTVEQSRSTYNNILRKHIDIPTREERRLMTGSFKEMTPGRIARDFLEKGAVIPVDPLINMISGRQKQLKKELAASREQNNAEILHRKYSSFLREELEIAEDKIWLFIYFVSGKNNVLSKNNNIAQVKRFLRNYYLQFLDQNTAE